MAWVDNLSVTRGINIIIASVIAIIFAMLIITIPVASTEGHPGRECGVWVCQEKAFPSHFSSCAMRIKCSEWVRISKI